MPERRARDRSFLLLLGTSLPLPGALAVETLHVNAFPIRQNIYPHPAGPGRPIDRVHLKPRILDVQTHFNPPHRFNLLLPAHRFRVPRDDLIEGKLRAARFAEEQQRRKRKEKTSKERSTHTKQT